jgi:hypothetical protein
MKRFSTLATLAILAAVPLPGCEAPPAPANDIAAAEAETPETIEPSATADPVAEPSETATDAKTADELRTKMEREVTKKAAKATETAKVPPFVVQLVLPDDETSPFLTEASFVMTWMVLGPFRFAENDFGGGHQQTAADHEFIQNEAAIDGAQEAPEGTIWQRQTFTGHVLAGQIDLNRLYQGIDHAASYAVTWLDSPVAVEDAILRIGSDDYVKIWINGELVLTYNKQRRSSDWDQDSATNIKLKMGLNRIVVKCVDVVGGYDFYFRLTDKLDRPINTKLRPDDENASGK